MHTLRWWAVVAVTFLMSLAGCRSYERRPLNLHDHAARWRSPDLATEPVLAYARRLAGDGAEAKNRVFDVSDGVSLQEAEAIALHFNAALRVARAEAEVPLASAREAGWWPDPEFQANVLRFADRGSDGGFKLDGPSIDGINGGGVETTPLGIRRVAGDYVDDPWIVGASLSITVPLSGRLAVEKDLAWCSYRTVWRHILIEEWKVVQQLRAAWTRWSATRERIALTQDHLERLEHVTNSAERLASAGELKATDARVLAIRSARQRVALAGLESEGALQRMEILSLLGVAPETPIELLPALSVAVIEPPGDRRQEALMATHPELLAAEAAYEQAEQQLKLEIRMQYPDLTVGPSYSFEEGFSRIGWSFGAPIPLWNRNRQAIAEAIAARDAARVRAEAVTERVLAELFRAEAGWRAAEDRRSRLATEVAPLADRQVHETQQLLELGEADVLLLREALEGSLTTKLDILDATLTEALAAQALRSMLQPVWVTLAETREEEE